MSRERSNSPLFVFFGSSNSRSAIWEKMHRQFVDERLRRRLAKERGESHVTGSGLNKSKVKKEMEASMDPSLFSSSTWGPAADSSSTSLSLPNAPTKKIRIGASIESSDQTSSATPATTEGVKTTNALGSIAKNILDEGKGGKVDEGGEEGDGEEEVEEEGDDEGALVYEYDAVGMDDYDDDGDDEYY
jgi:hypothetical protein